MLGVNEYSDWVENNIYKNKQNGELVNYGGVFVNADTHQRGKLIAREGSDTFEEISHEEFDRLYEKVSRS